MASEISSDPKPIDKFKSWALRMGCPVNALPSDLALDRLMKSNPDGVQKLMDRFRPKAEVRLCRDNLLASSLSERQPTDQPGDWQHLKRKEKIKRQIDELKPCVERLRTDVKDQQSNLLEKAQQIKEAKRTHRGIKSKSIQLEQKRAQLTEKIEVEKRLETLLANGTSVPIDVTVDSKSGAERCVKKSLQYLKNVYKDLGDQELTKADKDKVHREIKAKMAGIPVVTLFEAIKNYHKLNAAQFNPINQQPPSEPPAQSTFDVAITKSRIRMYVDHHLARRKLNDEYSARVEQYVQLYDEYLERMINETKSSNESDVELFADSICTDYLKQYGTSVGNQAMLRFKQKKLAMLQQRVTERNEQLQGSDVVAAELTDMYQLIEKTYNSAYGEIVLLSDTNKSLKELQALCIYTINSFGQQRSKLNTSINPLNATLGPIVSSMNVSPAEYTNELSLLVNVMHEQWNRLTASMDVQCQRPNEALSPVYALLTPNGTLAQLKKKWAWHKVIEALTHPLDVNVPLPQVNDVQRLSANLNAESVKMAKIMDEIRFMWQTGNQTVAEIRKYLEFLLDTSLGSFIPDRVMINRRNFGDYEEEFLCACSLIANSMKKK